MFNLHLLHGAFVAVWKLWVFSGFITWITATFVLHALQSSWMCHCSVSISEIHYSCVNSINCNGKNMSDELLYALSQADANMYLCSEDLRSSKKLFYSFSSLYDSSFNNVPTLVQKLISKVIHWLTFHFISVEQIFVCCYYWTIILIGVQLSVTVQDGAVSLSMVRTLWWHATMSHFRRIWLVCQTMTAACKWRCFVC